MPRAGKEGKEAIGVPQGKAFAASEPIFSILYTPISDVSVLARVVCRGLEFSLFAR